MGSTVDARDIDFSDSIAARRKAYRIKNRRRRRRTGGSDNVGDSSESEEETLARKLARLRREVEELKHELDTRQSPPVAGEDNADLDDGIAELSRTLDNVYVSARGFAAFHSVASVLAQKIDSEAPKEQFSGDNLTRNHQESPGAVGNTALSAPSGILAHAVAFDSRLALIEAAMGISSSSNPFITDGASEPALRPVLPALENLTSRLTALSSILAGPSPASAVPTVGSAPPTMTYTTTHLEVLSARVRKLTTDAEALASARKRAVDAAKAAQAARIAAATLDSASDMSLSSSSATEVESAASQRDEQAAKIQALYATLPTIQSLHPLLPSVLERLRSLRAIHAGAAQAAESLNTLEKRQAEMNQEIEQWRQGLHVVEEKMNQGEAALKSNIELVEPWVRALERRLESLINGSSSEM